VQDDWKVTDRLTVNLGVRYDYQSPWIEKDNQLTFLDEDATDPLTGRKGIVRLVGRDGNSPYQNDPDRNNIAPRLGFAWQFTPAMVLRGGYGGGVGRDAAHRSVAQYLAQRRTIQRRGAIAAQHRPARQAARATISRLA
jgi:outer membrane receptor protein involved in Fe transport